MLFINLACDIRVQLHLVSAERVSMRVNILVAWNLLDTKCSHMMQVMGVSHRNESGIKSDMVTDVQLVDFI